MGKRIKSLIVGALFFSVSLGLNKPSTLAFAEETISEIVTSNEISTTDDTSTTDETETTDPTQEDDKTIGDKIKDEISNFKDTYLVPLLSGVSITSVLGAIFSLIMAILNRKNNKKSNDEIIESSKQVANVAALATKIIQVTMQIMDEIKNQNAIAENTRLEFQQSSKALFEEIATLTNKTEELQNLKPILATLATIDSKIALCSSEVIKNGLGTDIATLAEQIKSL